MMRNERERERERVTIPLFSHLLHSSKLRITALLLVLVISAYPSFATKHKMIAQTSATKVGEGLSEDFIKHGPPEQVFQTSDNRQWFCLDAVWNGLNGHTNGVIRERYSGVQKTLNMNYGGFGQNYYQMNGVDPRGYTIFYSTDGIDFYRFTTEVVTVVGSCCYDTSKTTIDSEMFRLRDLNDHFTYNFLAITNGSPTRIRIQNTLFKEATSVNTYIDYDVEIDYSQNLTHLIIDNMHEFYGNINRFGECFTEAVSWDYYGSYANKMQGISFYHGTLSPSVKYELYKRRKLRYEVPVD